MILSLVLAANAQGVGSSRGLASGDGIQTIQGRDHFTAGQSRGSSSVRVSLESVSSFGTLTSTTDEDGVFRFRNLQPGGYTVVVDAGKEYEIARETVNIDREASPGGRIVQIAIQLHFKVDGSNPAFAGVPQNALDFYQKGAAAPQKGNAKDAAEFLSQASSAYPNFSLAMSELGLQYIGLRQ